LALLAFEGGSLPRGARLFFLTGLLGSFTTYSTFSYETIQLLRRSLPRLFLLNVAANTLLCLLAAWGGLLLAHVLRG